MKTNDKCSAVKELSIPQLVIMPEVPENSKIFLIVPVTQKDFQKTINFLKSFGRNSIEKSQTISLMLVFLYTPQEWMKYKNNVDIFKDIKQRVKQMMKKYKRKTSSHLVWQSMQTKRVTIFTNQLMDLAIHKLDNNTLILLGSPSMEIHSDYFTRVHQNTIPHKQVYCPVPFTEYNPHIIYSKKVPATLRFHPSNGHFDIFNHQHISFYKYDFDKARDDAAHDESMREVFSHGTVITFVAVEPGLRLRYQEVDCRQEWRQQELRRCLVRKRRSLGKRSQLAGVVMDKGL